MSNISKHSVRPQQKTRIWIRVSLQRYSFGLAAFAILLIGTIQWQQQGADPKKELFFAGNVAAALDQAEAADQLCLLYFETSYCYPCDQFVSQSRKDDELWSLLTEDYLTLGLSSDTGGEEVQTLIKQFDIQQFPTLLVTDSEGNELHRFSSPNEMKNLAHDLASLNQLRVAPHASVEEEEENPTYESDSFVELAQEGEKKVIGKMGVMLLQTDDYQVALHQAELLKLAWEGGIWIQSDGKGSYGLVIGSFESKKEAKLTARYLKKWNNEPAKIVHLDQESFHF